MAMRIIREGVLPSGGEALLYGTCHHCRCRVERPEIPHQVDDTLLAFVHQAGENVAQRSHNANGYESIRGLFDRVRLQDVRS